jgi:hypothetical protein
LLAQRFRHYSSIVIVRLALVCFLLFGRSILAAPDNDDFSNRSILTGTSGSFFVYQLDATREELEPTHSPSPNIGYASVWWTWTAPADGTLRVAGDQSDLYITVYTGNELSQLSQVAGAPVQNSQALLVPVERGVSYQIAISLPSVQPREFSSGLVSEMQFHFYPPPPNDLLANHIIVDGSIVELEGYTVGATRDLTEPLNPDRFLPNTVWWQWTPPATGIVFIEGASSFPGILWPYAGSQLNQLVPIPLSATRDSFEVKGGQTIQMAVGNYTESLAGPVKLRLVLSTLQIVPPTPNPPQNQNGTIAVFLTNLPPSITRIDLSIPIGLPVSFPPTSLAILTNVPPGIQEVRAVGIDEKTGDQFLAPPVPFVVSAGADSFADAREIPGGQQEIGGDFTVATREPGEPRLAAENSGSIWWRWTAPVTGLGRLENPPIKEAYREVFTGQTLTDLQTVPYENAASPGDPLCVFKAEEGRTYFIRLSKTAAGTGWGSTLFSFLPSLANDHFANAEPLGDSTHLTLPRGASTCQPGEPEPCAPDTGSRWYQFIPTANGTAWVDLENWIGIRVQYSTSLSVYTGDSLASLTQLFAGQPTGPIQIQLTAATRYYLRVLTPNSYAETIDIRLHFDFFPKLPNDDIANAMLIPPVEHGTITATTDLATREPADPAFVAGPSAWFRFVAPQDGTLLVALSAFTSTLTNLAYGGPYPPRLGFASDAGQASLTWDDSQLSGGGYSAIRLRAGQETFLAVWSWAPTNIPISHTSFDLDHFFLPKAANDDPSGATVLEGNQVSATGLLWNATPDLNPATGTQRSLWWKWFAQQDGVLNLKIQGGYFTAFSGTDPANLILLQSFGGIPFSNTVEWQTPVLHGNWYALRLTSFDDAPLGVPFEFFPDRLSLDHARLDFSFSSVRLLSPTNGSVVDLGAPITFQMASPDPNVDGNVSFATFLRATNIPAFRTLLPLSEPIAFPYLATITNLFPALYEFQALVTNDLGQRLLSAPVRVRIPPPNDNFTNAIPLFGPNLDVSSVFSGSTIETKEPSALLNYGSVWYNWRPSAGGPARCTFLPSPGDPSVPGVSVYTGTSLTNLKFLASTGVPFNARPDTNYFISVSGPTYQVGTLLSGTLHIRQTTVAVLSPTNLASFAFGQPIPIDLTTTESSDRFSEASVYLDTNQVVVLSQPDLHFLWSNLPAGPHQLVFNADFKTGEPALRATNVIYVARPNDFFSNRVVIPFPSGQVSGSTFGATFEIGVPGTSLDVWYQWTAPADGLLFLTPADGFARISTLRLYTGDSLTNLIVQSNRLAQTYSEQRGEWQVRSNVTYVLAYLQPEDPRVLGDFTLNLDFRPKAPNDAFADRISLSGTSGRVNGDTTLATLEPNEQLSSQFDPISASVWWTWTPPRNGILEISYPLQNAPRLSVRPWIGTALTGLSLLPLVGDLSPFSANPTSYAVTAGVPLQISLVTSAGDQLIPWEWQLLTPPPNDNFADRITLSRTQVTVKGTTLGAIAEPNEPTNPPFFGGPSTWWSWTPDQDLDLRINVTSAAQLLDIAIFSGSELCALQLVSFGYSQIPFEFPVHRGVTYQIMVGGGPLPGADYEMTLVARGGTPTNDNFAAAQILNASSGEIIFNNKHATREFREPNHAGHFGGRSVWYIWNAPQNGTLDISRTNEFFLLVAAYFGNSVTNLSEVGSSLLSPGAGTLKIPVQAGEQYRITMDSPNGTGGENTLFYLFTPAAVSPQLSANFDPAGSLTISAEGDEMALLETSTDWRTWTPVQEPPIVPGKWQISIGTEPSRFFRLRVPSSSP